VSNSRSNDVVSEDNQEFEHSNAIASIKGSLYPNQVSQLTMASRNEFSLTRTTRDRISKVVYDW
jgi:hypothetical protein